MPVTNSTVMHRHKFYPHDSRGPSKMHDINGNWRMPDVVPIPPDDSKILGITKWNWWKEKSRERTVIPSGCHWPLVDSDITACITAHHIPVRLTVQWKKLFSAFTSDIWSLPLVVSKNLSTCTIDSVLTAPKTKQPPEVPPHPAEGGVVRGRHQV